MPSLSCRELALELHESNQRLQSLLDTLTYAPQCADASFRVPTPSQMSELLSILLHAGQLLRDAAHQSEAALQSEISRYRCNVERLRALLPGIRSSLLTERARLERERERLTAAAHWAHLSQQTL